MRASLFRFRGLLYLGNLDTVCHRLAQHPIGRSDPDLNRVATDAPSDDHQPLSNDKPQGEEPLGHVGTQVISHNLGLLIDAQIGQNIIVSTP